MDIKSVIRDYSLRNYVAKVDDYSHLKNKILRDQNSQLFN